MDHFKTLSPALADLEIRTLDTSFWVEALLEGNQEAWLGMGTHSDDEDDEEQDELTTFVLALTSRLRLHRDWELVNAWMNVLLKVHADMIVSICSSAPPGAKKRLSEKERRARKLKEALEEWRLEHGKEKKRVGDLVGYCAGVVSFLRG